MKSILKSVSFLVTILLLNNCSPSMKVINSWTEKGANNLQNKNVLVITKAKDNAIRITSEEAMTNQLKASNIKAKSSFNLFSILDPDRKLNKDEVEDVVKKIKDKGFNVIVLTALKDYNEAVHTEESGGYYAGSMYYSPYIVGFGAYYDFLSPYYYDSGVYVPSETTTSISKKYILETVTYNLDLPKNKELISITTIEIEDPDDLEQISKKYAKDVVSRLLKNN